ncbi:hypothetical protein FAF44_06380 [Nonomuraea sp. MG754425]|uniref:hypothetical protein n=1 Tax=Nonomuraea sp. MG754425 TaxID=2570319 RepID=UPI001F2A9E30|nr:hypothetical protein [Nonomuraea sp. MG754425]MCF6468031.1 hypothetical protein [Nonomuraea sp. MG754425]
MSPTLEHEYLIELVRNRPTLATSLLARVTDIEIPYFDDAQLGNCDFTDTVPAEFRADSVVLLTREGKPVAAVVLEVQRAFDKRKQFTWPVYLATLRSRQRCPVLLLVFCTDGNTASACREPIHMGHPGWVLHPAVATLRDVPKITDVEQARAEPELAALSAIAYGSLGGDEAWKVLRAWVEAEKNPLEGQASYSAIVHYLLTSPEAVQMFKELEVPIGIPEAMRNPIIREAVEYGKAKTLLMLLDKRNIHVPIEAQERILACTDETTLDTWIDRILTITTVDELFD